MAEVEIKVKEDIEEKPVLSGRVVGLDTDPLLVVKWIQEERELHFKDEEDFLELDTEVVAALSRTARMRYDLAKAITRGEDVVETVEDGARGWSREYKVMPGSAASRTFVKGKDPNKDYYFAREDSVDYHMAKNGFQVTRDKNITVGGRNETCTYKTVGGQRATESVLLERPKELAEQIKVESKRKRDELTKRTRNQYNAKVSEGEFSYAQNMDEL